MAKRKKRNENKNSTYSVELTGLILILIGIIGMGFGAVGKYIKGFLMFLAGEYWFIILLLILTLGIYMLFKRKLPKFFSAKLIGVYILVLIILTIAHFKFLDLSSSYKEMIEATYENFMERIGTITVSDPVLSSGDNSITIGGGIIGSLVLSLLYGAFGKVGSIIVIIIFSLFSIILMFNITISDIFSKLINKIKSAGDDEDNEEKKKDYIIEGDELVGVKDQVKEEPEKDKIVITSIDDLKAMSIENTPEVKEIIPEETIDNDNHTDSTYRLPSIDLLKVPPKRDNKNSEEAYARSNVETLERVLNDFEIKGKVVEIHVGPTVTEYEITVPSGTKVNKIVNINKEIALAMAAKQVRIQAPIPGKNTIGIEIPNRNVASVAIREVFEHTVNQKRENKILVTLGKDVMGIPFDTDLTKTPHLLVAGSTGSGKSVCINSIIASILMLYKPDEVKLVLVDPKKVELSNYNGIPHLLCPVVTDPKKASATLQMVVREMEKRYSIFEQKGVKNIAGYNEMIAKENKKHPDKIEDKMYYIVTIIDELADLMLVASKEVEDSIMRITQMARAAGIHLIVATQRPSTDIITGVIKNNIPSRISFSVSSAIDSRTILDQAGAEKLLGRGDMLYKPMEAGSPTRIQGCFISDEEIESVIKYCKEQATVKYNDDFVNTESAHSQASGMGGDGEDDPMYDEIVEFAIQTGKISASLIQRRFRFGYNRAARMIDILESRGIVGPQNGSKPREVLVKLESSENSED